MTRRAITVLALVCALSTGLAASAVAASKDTPAAAISDCNAHTQLTAHYSPATLRAALVQMPVDTREYTNCYDVIERQLFSELGQSKSGPSGTVAQGSSGSFLPTWLIVVLVLLALAAVSLVALAIRRRRIAPAAHDGEPPPGPGPGGPPG
jgi:hypothetical protein